MPSHKSQEEQANAIVDEFAPLSKGLSRLAPAA